MLEVIKVSASLKDIEATIRGLKEKYENTAFISYIDGEYGMRVSLYKFYVRDFVNKIRYNFNDSKIIGLCFIGHKSFIEEYCDYIIEVQDTKFENVDIAEKNEHYADADYTPTSVYTGSDGWDRYYIGGLYNETYEKMLEDINFSNIFFTTHCDGSMLISKFGARNFGSSEKMLYQINGISFLANFTLPDFINKTENNNKNIALHIRNSNKWPHRNLPESVYRCIFNYCIDNSINLYVFTDLIDVDLPKNEYIHRATKRLNNIQDIDHYRDIINNCQIFIGSDSGFSEFVLYYTNISKIYIHNSFSQTFSYVNNYKALFHSDNQLINLINNNLK
jgi:hypothetical protein